MPKPKQDLLIQHMEDPFWTRIHWEPDGSVNISVHGGVQEQTDEVLAECDRRLRTFVDFIEHIHRR